MNWANAMAWIMKPEGSAPRDLLNYVGRRVTIKPPRPKIKFPRGTDKRSKTEIQELELERLCKLIVKRRDLGPDGWGNCVSCGANSNRLQWGHFVPQHKSPWLRFWPPNSAMQCAQCNGPGSGMPREFARAIDDREKCPGFADALELEAKRHVTWKPSVMGWQEKIDQLKAILNLTRSE